MRSYGGKRRKRWKGNESLRQRGEEKKGRDRDRDTDRERERERDRQTDRQTEKSGANVMERSKHKKLIRKEEREIAAQKEED